MEEEIEVLRGVGTSAQLGAPRATKPPPALRQAPTRANPPTLSGENIIISAASLCHHAFNGDLSSHYHEILGRRKKEICTQQARFINTKAEGHGDKRTVKNEKHTGKAKKTENRTER